MDDQRSHQRRAPRPVEVTRIAVGCRRLAQVRIAGVPPSIIKIQKSQCVRGKRYGRGIVRPLGDFSRLDVVRARQPERIERHEPEAQTTQASGLGYSVVAVLPSMQFKQAVKQHALLVEEMVHP